MSTSDLYIINGKSVSHVAEYRNGWGSAPICWDFLADRYFPDVNFTDYMRPDFVGHDRKWKMVWGLTKDDRLSNEEKVTLMVTFDNAYVPVEYLKEAGEALKKFYDLSRVWSEGKVNHWDDIGNDLIRLAGKKMHRHARGVALSCTSVSDPWIGDNPDSLEKAWPIFEEPLP